MDSLHQMERTCPKAEVKVDTSGVSRFSDTERLKQQIREFQEDAKRLGRSIDASSQIQGTIRASLNHAEILLVRLVRSDKRAWQWGRTGALTDSHRSRKTRASIRGDTKREFAALQQLYFDGVLEPYLDVTSTLDYARAWLSDLSLEIAADHALNNSMERVSLDVKDGDLENHFEDNRADQ